MSGTYLDGYEPVQRDVRGQDEAGGGGRGGEGGRGQDGGGGGGGGVVALLDQVWEVLNATPEPVFLLQDESERRRRGLAEGGPRGRGRGRGHCPL